MPNMLLNRAGGPKGWASVDQTKRVLLSATPTR
jgi:hypothetical protein